MTQWNKQLIPTPLRRHNSSWQEMLEKLLLLSSEESTLFLYARPNNIDFKKSNDRNWERLQCTYLLKFIISLWQITVRNKSRGKKNFRKLQFDFKLDQTQVLCYLLSLVSSEIEFQNLTISHHVHPQLRC